MTANKARGERTVKIGKTSLTLVPSFEAIQVIEAEYEGLLAIGRRIEFEGSMTACRLVLWAAASEGGTKADAPSLEDIGKMILCEGADALVASQVFIAACMTGDQGIFEPAEDKPNGDAKSDDESEREGPLA
jgi:hypothetical protein